MNTPLLAHASISQGQIVGVSLSGPGEIEFPADVVIVDAEQWADAVKRAKWYGLLARAGGRASIILCMAADAIVIQGNTHYCTYDSHGLPIETQELRSAIETALEQA